MLFSVFIIVYVMEIKLAPKVLLLDCAKGAVAGSVIYWGIEWLFFRRGK
jgi:hypothetical protein